MKSSMGGHPIQLFVDNKIADNHDLICSICMDVLNDPTQCTEGHLFCRTCIIEHLKKSASCPTCRAELTDKNLSSNRFAKNLISTISIFCSTLGGHMPSCPKKPILCTNKGCSETVFSMDIDKHKGECLWETISCPLNLIGACSKQCPRNLQRKDLESHLSSFSTICASIQALVGLKRKSEAIQDKLTASQKEKETLKETLTKENKLMQESLASTKLSQVITTEEMNELKDNIIDIEESNESKNKEIDFQFKIHKISIHLLMNLNVTNSGPSNIIQKWLSKIGVIEVDKYDRTSLDIIHDQIICAEIDNFKGVLAKSHISLFRFHKGEPWNSEDFVKNSNKKGSQILTVGSLSVAEIQKDFISGEDNSLKLFLTLNIYESNF
eukprot:gene8152-16761_t